MPPTESTLYPGVCPQDTQGEYRERYSWLPYKSHCYLFVRGVNEWADAAVGCNRHGKWQTHRVRDTLGICCPNYYITLHLFTHLFCSEGGTLASIEDPDEQQFIASNLEIFKDSHTSFWIGLYKTHKGMNRFLLEVLGFAPEPKQMNS